MNKHEWREVSFSFIGYIECVCGFRPISQEDMDNHIPISNTEIPKSMTVIELTERLKDFPSDAIVRVEEAVVGGGALTVDDKIIMFD